MIFCYSITYTNFCLCSWVKNLTYPSFMYMYIIFVPSFLHMTLICVFIYIPFLVTITCCFYFVLPNLNQFAIKYNIVIVRPWAHGPRLWLVRNHYGLSGTSCECLIDCELPSWFDSILIASLLIIVWVLTFSRVCIWKCVICTHFYAAIRRRRTIA